MRPQITGDRWNKFVWDITSDRAYPDDYYTVRDCRNCADDTRSHQLCPFFTCGFCITAKVCPEHQEFADHQIDDHVLSVHRGDVSHLTMISYLEKHQWKLPDRCNYRSTLRAIELLFKILTTEFTKWYRVVHCAMIHEVIDRDITTAWFSWSKLPSPYTIEHMVKCVLEVYPQNVTWMDLGCGRGLFLRFVKSCADTVQEGRLTCLGLDNGTELPADVEGESLRSGTFLPRDMYIHRDIRTVVWDVKVHDSVKFVSVIWGRPNGTVPEEFLIAVVESGGVVMITGMEGGATYSPHSLSDQPGFCSMIIETATWKSFPDETILYAKKGCLGEQVLQKLEEALRPKYISFPEDESLEE